jgi:hypothetical protein
MVADGGGADRAVAIGREPQGAGVVVGVPNSETHDAGLLKR